METRRTPSVVCVAVAAVAASGLVACGGQKRPEAWARPQVVRLAWTERCGVGARRLDIRVDELVVRARSWAVDAAVRNRTDVPIAVGGLHSRMPLFGLEPFATRTRREVVERSERLAAKPRLVASRFDPPLAGVMAPGYAWHGRFSGVGRLPTRRYLRVVLGRFNVLTEQPRSFSLCMSSAFRLR